MTTGISSTMGFLSPRPQPAAARHRLRGNRAGCYLLPADRIRDVETLFAGVDPNKCRRPNRGGRNLEIAAVWATRRELEWVGPGTGWRAQHIGVVAANQNGASLRRHL